MLLSSGVLARIRNVSDEKSINILKAYLQCEKNEYNDYTLILYCNYGILLTPFFGTHV